MYQSKGLLKVTYSMATTPGAPQTPKSRGLSLFDRQAQLHAYDSEQSVNTLRDPPLSVLRPVQSLYVAPPAVSTRSTSPRLNHPRIPEPLTNKSKSTDALQETDFPLEEPTQSLNPTNSLCCATVEQAFNYLDKHDDDEDVINVRGPQYDRYDENYDENRSDGDDSVDTIDLDAATIHSRPSTNDGSSGIGSDHRHDSEEKLTEYPPTTTTTIPGGPMSEDNDSSDGENQSHEDEMDHDDEPIKEDLVRQQAEQKRQLLVRQQKIMRTIEQEWIRKEKTFIDELEKLSQYINGIPAANSLQNLIQNLLPLHRKVQREVELLYDRDQQSSNLLRQIAQATSTLMQTLQFYDEFMKEKLSNLRKALEKRIASPEDLLSVLPRQYLQILSQVQDLYKTAQSFDSNDDESRRQLFDYAHACKIFGSRQDETINKVILKEDDVGVLTNKGTRERCHIILYPDALIGCILKTSLLTSAKYTLAWHVSMIDLTWKTSTQLKTDSVETGDDLKSNLKSAYQELEKASTPTVATSRLRKIRKQENEYNLAHSNLPLTLENPIQSGLIPRYTILFSSAYQRQEWIDLLEKTKRELVERSSALADPINSHNQRLKDLVQKRLESIKPPAPDSNVNDGSAAAQSRKTYSGTLNITIYSLHGLALCHSTRSGPPLSPADPDKYQFYVAVEIDSYNTFHPYAQTAKRPMQNNEAVEFRGEAFQVELECSQAFRLIIYRLDTTNPQSRAQCIGKFHRNIENALRECDRQLSGILPMESPNDDLKLKISLKYEKRDGTFRRQPSKRNKAIFGKSIEILMSTSNGTVDGIPRIIVKCIEMVDREGLEETGIYRVCCVTSDLQKLRHEFDRQPLRAEEMLNGKSVHVAANLLKLFFRELPEPLFTSSLYQQFVHATQLTDIDNRRVTLINTLELLHPDNRRILLYLLDHLLRVSEYSHINMMHLENLAVVFGPTLMRPSKLIPPIYFSGQGQPLSASHLDLASESDQMSTELQGSMHQCQVVLAYLKLRRDGLLK